MSLSTTEEAFFLRTIKPIYRYIEKRDSVEVSVNGPGGVWVKGKTGYRYTKDPNINWSIAEALMKGVIATSGQVYSEEYPIAAGVLPGGHRFYGIVSKANVETGFAFSIRVHRAPTLRAQDFGVHDINAPLAASALAMRQFTSTAPANSLAWLLEVLKEGGPVLVSGGTDTGKTSFVNSILFNAIPRQKRIIMLEDTFELRPPHENLVRFLTPRIASSGNVSKLTGNDFINSAVRMNPDVIILGELDINNATAALRMMNLGESSFIMTMHANSPLDALDAFRRNILLAGGNPEGALGVLLRSVSAIVQLTATLDLNTGHRHRTVSSIVRPSDLTIPEDF